ncbi:MAG: molybdopterin-dependent oxidoreductase [Sphingobium sp.]
MPTREEISFCRLCGGACGTRVTVDEQDKIVSVRGDREHPLSRGYACAKGLDLAEMHNRPDRLLHPMKRMPDGSFARIGVEDALDEIGEGMRRIIDRDGPDAVACFMGTQGFQNSLAAILLPEWLRAIGSNSFYSSLTIDQSAKVVCFGRMGGWGAGKQIFDTSDVWLMFGSNPLVSITSSAGMPVWNATKTIKDAKARGLKLIVVDPRRTETAEYADLFISPKPGEDATIVAGMLRLILAEGLEDKDFCARYVDGLDVLRAAVEPFTPDYVARRAGIPLDAMPAAARMFATAKRGSADSATGVCMGPNSNLTVHLIEALNVVCGRYARAGERIPNPGISCPTISPRAEVIPPPRWWESGPRVRTRDLGRLRSQFAYEMPASVLSDEILTPGKGQVRALLVEGGNPANALPDRRKTLAALRDLELLVALEPLMTATARLAHYILPPRLIYERPDLPVPWNMIGRTPWPFSQFTPAIVPTPPGSELVDDWYVLWAITKRLGCTLELAGDKLDMVNPPHEDELFALMSRGGAVPFEEVRRHPHGKLFDLEPRYVGDAQGDARFDLFPADVAAELAACLDAGASAGAPGADFGFSFTVRRMRDTMNSLRPGGSLKLRSAFNPAYMHPGDIEGLGLQKGSAVFVESRSGRIPAVVEPDAKLRPGIVSMAHCWGEGTGIDFDAEDYASNGSCTSTLVDADTDLEDINGMVWMTAIPVRVTPRAA